jgi:hypothetical protein
MTRQPLPASAARARWMPFVLIPLCGAAGACFGGPTGDAWNAPPFSADVVDLRDGGRTSTHVSVGVGKLRLESAAPGKTTAFVFDPQKSTLLVIDDQAKTYIDAGMFSSLVAAGMAPMLRLFRPAADGDPCTAWNGTVNQFASFTKHSGTPPHFSCAPMGTDVVGGRPTHKWSVVATGGNDASNTQSTVWIDDRLHILTKSTDANGSMEMRNVREGAPSPDLFVAPAGYKKIGVTDLVSALAKGGQTGSSPGGIVGATGNDSSNNQSAAGDVMDKIKSMVKQP